MEVGSVWLDQGQTIKLFRFTKPALSSSDRYTTFHFVAGVFYTYYLILLEILVEKHEQTNNFSYAKMIKGNNKNPSLSF